MTPITNEDLYGSSSTPSSPVQPVVEPPPMPTAPSVVETTPLVVEEAPEVPMNPSVGTAQEMNVPPVMPESAQATVPPPPPMPKKSFLSTIGTIIIFIALFGAGVWISQWARQFLETGTVPTLVTAPTPTPVPISADPYVDWVTYSVIGGITKQPIVGISFKLPSDVLAPICDTTTCASQGTYLPGGTRFTVAPRGAEQILADFRGSTIVDVGGLTFTTTDATVSGRSAKEFTGVFTGRTVSGYAFSKMHGFMIAVTPTLSLEINHFTPMGITADFESDDALFAQIVKTLDFSTALVPTTTVIPISTPSSKGATGSGN